MGKVFECYRCASTEKVGLIYINDEPTALCNSCVNQVLSKKKSVGRPSLGVTKKVSLTLPEDDWEELDERANGNRSKFIRKAIIKVLDEDSQSENEIYFKDDFHVEQTAKILKAFGIKSMMDDIEYGLFAYVVGATYKADHVVRTIDDEKNLAVDELYEVMGVFSSSERGMISFALQLFNSSIDDIKLSDVMRSLDSSNAKVIKQAIEIRY